VHYSHAAHTGWLKLEETAKINDWCGGLSTQLAAYGGS